MSAARWRLAREPYPGPPIEETFDLAVGGLVIVDMQRYYTDPDGPFGARLRESHPDTAAYFYPRVRETVVPALRTVLACLRRARRPVIHVTIAPIGSGPDPAVEYGFAPTVLRRGGPRTALHAGSPWLDVTAPLAPEPGEIVLTKTGRSAFTSTGIDQVLRNCRVRHVLVGGCFTNGCVELTARDAADRGYETFVLEDACAAFDETAHLAALRNFERVDGTVLEARDVAAP